MYAYQLMTKMPGGIGAAAAPQPKEKAHSTTYYVSFSMAPDHPFRLFPYPTTISFSAAHFALKCLSTIHTSKVMSSDAMATCHNRISQLRKWRSQNNQLPLLNQQWRRSWPVSTKSAGELRMSKSS